MSDIKNKIIALSGQPVAGKGTTTKALVEKLKEQGYKDENIHVISTGDEFRRYFNTLIGFVRNLNDPDKIKEFSNSQEMQNLMADMSRRLALINTVSRLRMSNVDLSDFSIEQANNLKELEEIRRIIDNLIDEKIKEEGEKINSQERPEEIWIIDSRLAFHNIPKAFSVRLIASSEIAAKRLMNDKNRGEEDSSYGSLEEAKEAREKRRLGEQERYKQRYGVDLEDTDNYDLIIDTSYASIDDMVDTILTSLDYYADNRSFAKTWTSPSVLLPLQTERETLSYTNLGYDMKMMESSIQKNGYFPDKPIEVIESDGLKGIIEGHHRNFAAAFLGKTLVPYETIAKDDEKIPYGGGTAKSRMRFLSPQNLYGHEWMIEEGKKGERFSYNDVYPGIYEKLKTQREETR